MNEHLPEHLREEAEKFEKQQKFGALVECGKELSERNEVLKFPGLKPSSYEKIKIADEESQGWATPIDEIIAKMEEQGMKLALSTWDEGSGNMYIIPADMEPNKDNIRDYGLPPESFEVTDDMDEGLKKLIEAATEYKNIPRNLV